MAERQEMRIRKRAEVLFGSAAGPLTGYSADLSRSGLCLVAQHPPPPHQSVVLHLETPSGTVTLEGEVKWVQPATVSPFPLQTAGIALKRIPDAYRDFLIECLRHAR